MRFLLVLVPMLAAACDLSSINAGRGNQSKVPVFENEQKSRPRPRLVKEDEATAEPVKPVAVASTPPACPDRSERVRRAKETISAYHEHMRALIPLAKWAVAHKCELKDTTGSVLVSRTKEAGGVRITTTHGHENDIVCNVPAAQHPEGLDVERMMQIEKLDEIGMGDPLVDFGENCEDAELQVTYGDTDKQKKILALP